MTRKRLTIPLNVRLNQALLRRLPPNHEKIPIIREDLMKRNAGYRGEKALDAQLRVIEAKGYTIFQGLRLEVDQQVFQIDTLIISCRFALILEVKNIAGTLIFDQRFKQLIRVLDNKEEGFLDPISQAQRHKFLLEELLKKIKLFNVPILFKVVISNPSTIIKSASYNVIDPSIVIHLNQLLINFHKIENSYSEEKITKKELNKIKKVILKNHSIIIPNKSIYKVEDDEIRSGVLCEKCSVKKMIRRKTYWYCPSCMHKSASSHISALSDYCLLINPNPRNEAIKDFLNIKSSKSTRLLLQSMNIPHEGDKRWRRYLLLDYFIKIWD